ncbi:MAG: TlpA family protein disulfide reductase [Planctomycetaceae bacterium]|jgi:thiol-disulfide isomerase/thioredoxin|nr:TlpA family protein disulfide reductase [Planctomycetaceae bacterium]
MYRLPRFTALSLSVSAAAFTLLLALPLFAQDTDAKSGKAAAKPLEQLNTIAEIEQAVTAFSAEIIKEFQSLAAAGEKMTQEKAAPYLEKMGSYALAGGEKILKIAKDDAEKLTGYRLVTQGLSTQDSGEKSQHLIKLAKEEGISEEDIMKHPEKIQKILPKVLAYETAASKRLEALYADIEKEGKFLELLVQYRLKKLAMEGMKLQSGFTLESFEKYKNEAWQAINKLGGTAASAIWQLVSQLAASPEAQKADPKLQEKTLADFVAFVKSDKCTLPQEKKDSLIADLTAEKKTAVGAELKLYGKTLDDKDFDWNSLLAKNKFVLVKFTASWCGPCKGEIPGMLEAYKKYHGKGLEIVSVYVWDKLDEVKKVVKEEKLPWIIVSEELTEKSGGEPQGKFYGIKGVPTMLLIGKDGKVIADNARGETLQKKLAELF